MFDYDKFIRLNKDDSYKYLYETFSHLIFSIIWNYTNNREDANDLSQDVWIKIYLNINKFKDGNFKLWVATLCHRICIDKYRRTKTSDKPNYKTSDINDYNFLDYDLGILNNFSTKNLLFSEILNCLNNLEKNKQDVILLKLKGLTFREISILMNENKYTICNRHKLSIVEIIKQLEEKGIIKSKEIKKNKNHYKTPSNLKLYIQV